MEKKKIDHTKCLDKVRKQIIKANPAIKHVWFDLSNICEFVGNKKTKQNKTGQRLSLIYTHKKKNGEEVEKTEKHFVAHDYCPFCGKKY